MTPNQDFDPIEYINTPRWQTVSPGLDRTRELLAGLGNPQDSLKFVHVAGTNGKGSTSAFLASILSEAGYKTGLFTSPYIIEFSDRIRVNGVNITPNALCEVTLKVREVAEQMEQHPTEFELMTAVALLHFSQSECDIVILEVGLGGRLDSTNVIAAPEACVITRIGLDHTALLGSTEAQVASEKAGIIKPGCLVVSWPQDPDAQAVVDKACADARVSCVTPDFSQLAIHDVSLEGQTFSYKGYQNLRVSLLGAYQPYNAALAIEVIQVLGSRGWVVSDEALRDGLAQTYWPGRFELVDEDPIVIVDGGHNPQGAQALADSLESVFPSKKVVFLIGLLADKAYEEMVACTLPYAQAYVTVSPSNPRALSAADLAATIGSLAHEQGLDPQIEVAPSIQEGVQLAKSQAKTTGIMVAFGSLYSVAEIKSALRNS